MSKTATHTFSNITSPVRVTSKPTTAVQHEANTETPYLMSNLPSEHLELPNGQKLVPRSATVATQGSKKQENPILEMKLDHPTSKQRV